MCVAAVTRKRVGDGPCPFVIGFVVCSQKYVLSRGAEGGSRLRGSGQKKAFVSAGGIAMVTSSALPRKCREPWVSFPVLGQPEGPHLRDSRSEKVSCWF